MGWFLHPVQEQTRCRAGERSTPPDGPAVLVNPAVELAPARAAADRRRHFHGEHGAQQQSDES
jgi:hypothetical protein